MLKVKGEKASADEEQAEKFVAEFTNIVAMDGYLPENIYNADEMGISWHCLPDTTLALETEKQAFGAKLSKERITLLLCANASGTHKVDLLAIGKAKRPRGFPKSLSALPLHYANSKKAWMTRQIFEYWYDSIFIPQVEAFQEKSGKLANVLLLLDNAPVHHKDTDFDRQDGRFKVVFLPPNVTSLIQPMDQCIIASFKKVYRSNLLAKMIKYVDESEHKESAEFKKGFILINAIGDMKYAWDHVTQKSLVFGWKNLMKSLQWQTEDVIMFDFDQELDGAECFGVVECGEIVVTPVDEVGDELIEDELGGEAIDHVWNDIDEDDPGYGVLQEDEIEKAIFGDCFGDSSDEEEEAEGYEDEVLDVEEPAKVSHAEAVAAGLVFENWMRKNMTQKDVIIMRRFVDAATKKGAAGPKKQQAITSYYKT